MPFIGIQSFTVLELGVVEQSLQQQASNEQLDVQLPAVVPSLGGHRPVLA